MCRVYISNIRYDKHNSQRYAQSLCQLGDTKIRTVTTGEKRISIPLSAIQLSNAVAQSCVETALIVYRPEVNQFVLLPPTSIVGIDPNPTSHTLCQKAPFRAREERHRL